VSGRTRHLLIWPSALELVQDDDEVVLTPSKNGGPRKRFLFLKSKIRCRPVEEEVTQALKTAFDACE
jgi:hypothetical protein